MSDIGWLDTQWSRLLFLVYAFASGVYLVVAGRRALRASRDEQRIAGAVVPSFVTRSCSLAGVSQPLAHVLLVGLGLAWWRHQDGPPATPFVPITLVIVLAISWSQRELVRAAPAILRRQLPPTRISRHGALLLALHVALLVAVWATRWASWGRPDMGVHAPEVFAWVGLLAAATALFGMAHAGMVLRTARWLRSRGE